MACTPNWKPSMSFISGHGNVSKSEVCCPQSQKKLIGDFISLLVIWDAVIYLFLGVGDRYLDASPIAESLKCPLIWNDPEAHFHHSGHELLTKAPTFLSLFVHPGWLMWHYKEIDHHHFLQDIFFNPSESPQIHGLEFNLQCRRVRGRDDCGLQVTSAWPLGVGKWHCGGVARTHPLSHSLLMTGDTRKASLSSSVLILDFTGSGISRE